jgi:hypothetical protein
MGFFPLEAYMSLCYTSSRGRTAAPSERVSSVVLAEPSTGSGSLPA